jgi:hypothetical protein
MARVLALTADLLFGSHVQGALSAAGHNVRLVRGEQELRDSLAQAEGVAQTAGAAAVEVLVVDLTDDALDAPAIVHALHGELAGVRTLGYYSHVDPVAKEYAEEAGIELVVPRSRVAREVAALVDELLTRAR